MSWRVWSHMIPGSPSWNSFPFRRSWHPLPTRWPLSASPVLPAWNQVPPRMPSRRSIAWCSGCRVKCMPYLPWAVPAMPAHSSSLCGISVFPPPGPQEIPLDCPFSSVYGAPSLFHTVWQVRPCVWSLLPSPLRRRACSLPGNRVPFRSSWYPCFWVCHGAGRAAG